MLMLMLCCTEYEHLLNSTQLNLIAIGAIHIHIHRASTSTTIPRPQPATPQATDQEAPAAKYPERARQVTAGASSHYFQRAIAPLQHHSSTWSSPHWYSPAAPAVPGTHNS
ncbi:uncharacterized protein Triagg1_8178 [Trichoderma aggressivum f. europaeum]|uniref:Uncharacterized protein n=1 Tax=Trichoderma aggressivum f. europaeum TaxID=173218 RepID=A0AAE1I879_9HYPO|nr:hypothetical protein Triagg1_8178 [Trichoderma aggressivum f. europaeum]